MSWGVVGAVCALALAVTSVWNVRNAIELSRSFAAGTRLRKDIKHCRASSQADFEALYFGELVLRYSILRLTCSALCEAGVLLSGVVLWRLHAAGRAVESLGLEPNLLLALLTSVSCGVLGLLVSRDVLARSKKLSAATERAWAIRYGDGQAAGALGFDAAARAVGRGES